MMRYLGLSLMNVKGETEKRFCLISFKKDKMQNTDFNITTISKMADI